MSQSSVAEGYHLLEHHQEQDPLALLKTLVRRPDCRPDPYLGRMGSRASMPCFQPVINEDEIEDGGVVLRSGLPPFPRSTSLNRNSPLLSMHYRPSHQLTYWQGQGRHAREMGKTKNWSHRRFGSSRIPRSRPARNKTEKNSSRGQAPRCGRLGMHRETPRYERMTLAFMRRLESKGRANRQFR